MKLLFEIVKILLLALIVVLLSVDLGLLTLPHRAGILDRLGVNSGDLRGAPKLDTAETAVATDTLDYGAPIDSAVNPVSDLAAPPDNGDSIVVGRSGIAQPPAAGVEIQRWQAAQIVEGQGGAVANEKSEVETDAAEGFTDSDVADDGLQALIRERLSGRYEFPEHVKFRNTHLSVHRLFADAGIEVEGGQEVVLAVYCGHYSAPNPAGLYGGYRPFYTEVLVNHADQSIDGELWLDVDGDIKKSISFRSDLLISARQDSFYSRFNENCGSPEGFLPGKYANYSIGQLAPYYRQHFAEMASKVSDPDYAERLAECLDTEATLKECYRDLGD